MFHAGSLNWLVTSEGLLVYCVGGAFLKEKHSALFCICVVYRIKTVMVNFS